MIGGAAEVVGELDEHQGLNTTHVSFPGSTVTCRNTFFPSISVPTMYVPAGTSLTAKCSP